VVEDGSNRRSPEADNVPVPERAGPSPRRRRVLVVEDEALVAMEIGAALSEAGWEVAGPASTVAQALALIAQTGCDAAVLDSNLGTETAEPIAIELIRAGTPFVTVSGYSRDQQPPAMRNGHLVGKPLSPELVVAELNRCLSRTKS
jgi:DNA-binding response OmpR family regulator